MRIGALLPVGETDDVSSVEIPSLFFSGGTNVTYNDNFDSDNNNQFYMGRFKDVINHL